MKTKLVPIAAVLLAVVAAVLSIMLFTGGSGQNFTPPPFDENAQAGSPEVPEDAGYSQADAKAFTFSVAGNLSVNDGNVEVWLTNPSQNSIWMKVRILDEEGDVLGESGLIKTGEYVKAVKLDKMPETDAFVSLKIMAYEPDTYYSAGSALLNTKLKVS